MFFFPSSSSLAVENRYLWCNFRQSQCGTPTKATLDIYVYVYVQKEFVPFSCCWFNFVYISVCVCAHILSQFFFHYISTPLWMALDYYLNCVVVDVKTYPHSLFPVLLLNFCCLSYISESTLPFDCTFTTLSYMRITSHHRRQQNLHIFLCEKFYLHSLFCRSFDSKFINQVVRWSWQVPLPISSTHVMYISMCVYEFDSLSLYQYICFWLPLSIFYF